MDNWFDIVEPHQDIKDGDFDEVVFAAKLDEVVAGTAAPDYNDPYLFFKKTYFTDSITALLKKVERKLTEGKGGSVVEIQTLFGGGKTHALVSIYHYIKSGDRIKDLLPQNLELAHAKIAVIVGTPLNPLEGRNTDSLTINTLWGDIAYQLAGMEGYRAFEKTDKERIAPGKDKLRAFLQEQQPFIILFDEILEYITKAIGVQYGKTNLGSQTYALLQELTETISSVEKGMMIVTLPSSYLEDFGEKKEEALARLSKIFGRVESIETPVKGEEVYSIISRRPFHETIDQSKKDRIIHEYFKLYQKNKDELPQKARDAGFNKKMELAYPFHPDVIDILTHL
jgi:predicted AAA+ superfamily ATPase